MLVGPPDNASEQDHTQNELHRRLPLISVGREGLVSLRTQKCIPVGTYLDLPELPR